MWIFLNNRFVTREEAQISVFDHGFLYGDGVYETLKVYHGQFLLLERHLTRLRHSCEQIELVLPIAEEQWPSLLTELLQRNQLLDASIRITISRGEGELGLEPSLCSHPTVVVLAKPFVPYPAVLKTEGIRLELVGIRRNPLSAQSPRIKSLSFLNNILAKQEALRAGGFDALMLNIAGEISECTTSNLFFLLRGTLRTPSLACGILEGVTREIVKTVAQEEGIAVEEGHYKPAQLFQGEECFITNTSMEIMPVRCIGNHSIGSICPGPITTRLQELFTRHLERFLSTPPCLPDDCTTE